MKNFMDVLGPGEREYHFGFTPSAAQLRAERAHCARDRDYNCQHLFWHYLDHGRPDIAQTYFDMIEDPDRRLDAQMMAHECKD